MSTYVLSGEIIFHDTSYRKKFAIRQFSECKIESSWQSLTDTAEITLPSRKNFNQYNIRERFREGDPVEIRLGYDDNNELEFSGYIKKIGTGIPLVIQCEDEMYILKRKTISISIQNTTLKQLLQKIVPGYEIVCDESEVTGSFRFSNITQAQCLEELQKQGIYCWFIGKTLYSSIGNSRPDAKTHDIIIEKTAGESLKQKEIQTTRVIVELIRNKGKKQKVEFGDDNAQVIQRRSYSGMTMNEPEMLALAKRIYAASKQPGLDGDVTLFGVPRVIIGDKLKINSIYWKNSLEYNGTYCIDAVTKTFSPAGYRQACKLGLREL